MKAPEAGEPLDLEAVAASVVAALVTFGMPETEARQRINLWRSAQHDLEGQALEALPHEVRAEHLLRWALEGLAIADDLRAGAAALGLDFPPDSS